MVFLLCGLGGFAQDINYTVKASETLYGIANREQVKYDSLLKWNKLKLITTGKKDKDGNPIQEVQPAIKEGQILIVGKATHKAPKGEQKVKPEQPKNINETKKTETSETFSKTPKQPESSFSSVRIERGNDGNPIDPNDNKAPTSYSLWWLWLLLGFVGGAFCWEKWLHGTLLWFFNKKEMESKDDYIEELQNYKKIYKKENEELKEKNKKLSFENNEIRKECDEKQQQYEKAIKMLQNNQHIPRNVISEIVKQTEIHEQPKPEQLGNSYFLYADNIFDGHFNSISETPNEDSFFELRTQNAQNATFTIYTAAKQRIIANPSFLEGCDKQVLANASKLTVETEGSAQLQSDGKWKIIKKLNVTIS